MLGPGMENQALNRFRRLSAARRGGRASTPRGAGPSLAGLVCICLLGAWLAWPAQASGQTTALRHVDLAIAGRLVRVPAGGKVPLHPDTRFKVVDLKTGSWLDTGLKARLVEEPQQDLGSYRSLSSLLGEQVWTKESVRLEVYRRGAPIGGITIVIKPLAIDLLRKAQAASSLEQKIYFTDRVLKADPDNRLILLQLAELYTRAGRLREAIALLERRAAASDDPAVALRLARLYERTGQRTKAAAVYSKLLAEDPHNPFLLQRQAQIQLHLRRFGMAARLYQRLAALQSGEKRVESLGVASRLWVQAKRPHMAAQALSQAVKSRPSDPALWRRLAQAYRLAGDQQAASAALKEALALDPQNRTLRWRLVRQLVAAGRKKEAVAILERALKEKPDLAAYRYLAKLYEDLGDHKGQAHALRALAKQRPRDWKLQASLALLLAKTGQKAEAAQLLAKVIKARPGDRRLREAYLGLLADLKMWQPLVALAKSRPKDAALQVTAAGLLEKMGQKKLAAERLAAALKARPKDRQIIGAYGRLLVELGQWKEALALAKRLPKDVDLQVSLALLLDKSGQKEPAAERMAVAHKARPKDAQIAEAYFRLLAELKRWPEALALAKRWPKNADMQFSLALLLYDAGKKELAAERMALALKAGSSDRQALQFYFQLLVELKRWKPALAQARRLLASGTLEMKLVEDVFLTLGKEKPKQTAALMALAAKRLPKEQRIYLLRAVLLVQAGDLAAAAEALKDGLKALPDDRVLLEQLAKVYLAAGKQAESEKTFERLIGLSPQDPAPLLRLAALYEALGNQAAAIKTYRRLLKLKPKDLALLRKLAKLQEDAGQDNQAAKTYERILEQAPTDKQAADGLLRLRYRQLERKAQKKKQQQGTQPETRPEPQAKDNPARDPAPPAPSKPPAAAEKKKPAAPMQIEVLGGPGKPKPAPNPAGGQGKPSS